MFKRLALSLVFLFTRRAKPVPCGDRRLCETSRQGQQLVAADQRSQHTEVKDHGADQHQRRTEFVLPFSARVFW